MQPTSGIFRAQIDVFTTILTLRGEIPVTFKKTLSNAVFCPFFSPSPTPTPVSDPPSSPTPTPPPITPLTLGKDIEGDYIISCSQTADVFSIIAGNLGNLFNLKVNIIVSDLITGEVTITAHHNTTNEILFILTGTVGLDMFSNRVLNATGNGRLGDPTGSLINVKAENWVFSVDEGGGLLVMMI